MSLSDLEARAIERSSIRNETKRGYVLVNTRLGSLRVKHDRSAESGRGHTSFWLNSVQIDRARASALLA